MALCFPLPCVALLVFSLVALFPCIATKGGLASFVSPVVSLSFPRVRSSHLCFAVRCLACFGLLLWIAGKKYLSGGRHFVVEERIREESGAGGDLRPPFFFLGEGGVL